MSSAPREDNRVLSLVAKSDADNTPVIVEADPVTKRLKVSAIITSGGGGGGSDVQYTDGDAAVTHPIGTTAPTFSIGIPASGGVTVNWDKGIAFGTAISFGCTTTRTGSTGATCDVNFFYK
jgi:hypothetical protein